MNELFPKRDFQSDTLQQRLEYETKYIKTLNIEKKYLNNFKKAIYYKIKQTFILY